MPGWIGPAISLGLSAGSTLFNIGQSLRNQREARRARQEQIRQRISGLERTAGNYEGDANALLGHLLGERGEGGERQGGLLYARENTLGELNQFYDQSRSEMRNLFNYAGMSGARSEILMNQLQANREEDLERFGAQFNDQRVGVARDVITASASAYDALREKQKGFQKAGGDTLEEAASSVFERNSEALRGAMDFVSNTRELEGAFENPQQLADLIAESDTNEPVYQEAKTLAKAAAGATLDNDEIEQLGLSKQYTETVMEDGKKYMVTREFDNEAISNMLGKQFEAYAEGKDVSALDFEDLAGEGTSKVVKKRRIYDLGGGEGYNEPVFKQTTRNSGGGYGKPRTTEGGRGVTGL